ncbi:hypothetical protein J8I26_17555 [Herbaspirillum sp. LeCh32-8]|uniref:hypothetical protein n=1 Tax=Herbaspirillum sp. LeCh32-8 TaxID=2821356 RepID=UPI001AEADC4A|nr:hypothetical protein [Herbaspirillum sp. LeCh32-8]MBP0599920.1 hypothetical protein [Herbaspirillum sp. LeCh32-8]
MKKNILAVSLLLAAALAGAAHAAEEDVTRTDPARWYKADDTPKARLQNLTTEANAAYGEAVKECKGKRGKELKACRAEAGSAKKEDMERAKRIYNDYKATAGASS